MIKDDTTSSSILPDIIKFFYLTGLALFNGSISIFYCEVNILIGNHTKKVNRNLQHIYP